MNSRAVDCNNQIIKSNCFFIENRHCFIYVFDATKMEWNEWSWKPKNGTNKSNGLRKLIRVPIDENQDKENTKSVFTAHFFVYDVINVKPLDSDRLLPSNDEYIS